MPEVIKLSAASTAIATAKTALSAVEVKADLTGAAAAKAAVQDAMKLIGGMTVAECQELSTLCERAGKL